MRKIDVVITWVNGDDPRHREKRLAWMPQTETLTEDKTADTRFANLDEIFWCVASLNRFAPWINRIYIVTDQQDPQMDEFLQRNFPTGYIPYEIVDHTVIFKDYEQYLPTFNSISLETMTWRIPGLSDYYIEFNDDLMLAGPVQPEDFFTEDGKVICYAEWASLHMTKLTRSFKSKGQVTTKGSHSKGASIAGAKWRYLRLAHCQKALRRDFFERFFNENPELLEHNIQFRFRDVEQFTSQELQYIKLYDQGKCVVKSPKGKLFFFQPRKGDSYFNRKMQELNGFTGKFICFNSLDKAGIDQRKQLEGWIEERLSITL